MVASGTGAAGQVPGTAGAAEREPVPVGAALLRVAPGRVDAYEGLLAALAAGSVWVLLWSGAPGSPDARYGSMRVGGEEYVPCAGSAEQYAAAGWPRGHEVVPGRELAALLYRSRRGLWLDPHAPGGGVGVPWADLRRVALGLDRLPAGPLEVGHPEVPAARFYALLTEHAPRTPAIRGLYRAWVRPALGPPYLALGLDLYDTAPPAVAAARELVRHCATAAPPGCGVALLSVADAYDPVALWMTARARPFYTAPGA